MQVPNDIIIYLLFHFRTHTHVILSRILRKIKAHFGTALRPTFSLSIPVGHIQRLRTLETQPKQTMELRKHKAHTTLVLAENLGRGQSAIKKGQRSIITLNMHQDDIPLPPTPTHPSLTRTRR